MAKSKLASVIHFEIPADDSKRAGKFYHSTFGWEFTPMPAMGYTMIQTTASDKNGMPKNPGTVNGGMPKRSRAIPCTVVTIGVPNIDASLKAVAKNGGKVAQKKMSIGEMGFIAYFKDTEGNLVGLWQGPSE
ncbi:MAG: VOC family protein [Thermoplasmata archaeon]|nr:VOC family protein [Thermoplasmata archaeon]